MRKPYSSIVISVALAVMASSVGVASAWSGTAKHAAARTVSVRTHRIIRRAAIVLHRSKRTAALYFYIVRPGDTLSTLAGRIYGNVNSWPSLWWINKSQIRNPNEIQVGQRLKLSAWHPNSGWILADALRAATPVRTITVSYAAGSHSRSAYHGEPVQAAQISSYSSPSNYSGFQACVVARESDGNAQVMNSTGHYGLYQFSASTWAVYGGNPYDFGHASVAEQNRVFANAMASPGGANNWAPYDGC